MINSKKELITISFVFVLNNLACGGFRTFENWSTFTLIVWDITATPFSCENQVFCGLFFGWTIILKGLKVIFNFNNNHVKVICFVNPVLWYQMLSEPLVLEPCHQTWRTDTVWTSLCLSLKKLSLHLISESHLVFFWMLAHWSSSWCAHWNKGTQNSFSHLLNTSSHHKWDGWMMNRYLDDFL